MTLSKEPWHLGKGSAGECWRLFGSLLAFRVLDFPLATPVTAHVYIFAPLGQFIPKEIDECIRLEFTEFVKKFDMGWVLECYILFIGSLSVACFAVYYVSAARPAGFAVGRVVDIGRVLPRRLYQPCSSVWGRRAWQPCSNACMSFLKDIVIHDIRAVPISPERYCYT